MGNEYSTASLDDQKYSLTYTIHSSRKQDGIQATWVNVKEFANGILGQNSLVL